MAVCMMRDRDRDPAILAAFLLPTSSPETARANLLEDEGVSTDFTLPSTSESSDPLLVCSFPILLLSVGDFTLPPSASAMSDPLLEIFLSIVCLVVTARLCSDTVVSCGT